MARRQRAAGVREKWDKTVGGDVAKAAAEALKRRGESDGKDLKGRQANWRKRNLSREVDETYEYDD